MSTRGSTFYDEDSGMEWTVMAKPWCQSCMVPYCGCPSEPELTIPPNVVLGGDGD